MNVALRIGPDATAARIRRPPGVVLARVWIVVIFSNLPVYVGLFVFPAIHALDWLLVLFALTGFGMLASERGAGDRAGGFMAGLLGYACLCLIWYVVQGGGDLEILRGRLLSLAVCAMAYLTFAASPEALLAARRALVYMVIFCVVINIWDVVHPGMLVPLTSEVSTPGRAAGFFINPNQAGAALIAGFTLSVSTLPRRWRTAYITVVAIGVGLTFSRAAILGMLLVCGALVYRQRTFSVGQVLAALLVVGLLTWVAWLILSAQLQERYNIDPQVALDRILWILDPEGRADFSQEERVELLERGWDQFLAAPLLGHGVGSTELWEARTSTHNIYVMLASDFGVLGLFIFPCIVWSAMGSGAKRLGDVAVAGLFLLFWGLFSHNMLSEYYLLVTISLLAALSRRESGPGLAALPHARGAAVT